MDTPIAFTTGNKHAAAANNNNTCVRLRLLLAPLDPLAPDWNKEQTVLLN
jgi:hypothetical protein